MERLPAVRTDASPETPSPFRWSTTGLESVDGEPSFEQWSSAVERVRVIERGLMWIVGDLLLYGGERFSEEYAQIFSAVDYSHSTLRVARWVASRFPRERRVADLEFHHHQAVAALEPTEADALLAEAVEKNFSARELKSRVEELHPRERPATEGTEKIALPGQEASPASGRATALAAMKKFKQAAGLLSALFRHHGEEALGMAQSFAPTLAKTGAQVATGQYAGVTFGFPEYTCDELDTLYALCGGLRVMFEKMARPEVAGAGIAEWEERS